MKKLILGAMILASVLPVISKAQSVELVKVSSYATGYVTGSYDEYPSRGVKIGSKILLNDAYSTLQIDGHTEGTGYKYTMKPKQNLSICIYDADKNEYCDYQNLAVVKVDNSPTDYAYPSKVVLEYKGDKLPNLNVLTMSGIIASGAANYIGYDMYGTGYFGQTGTISDVLGEKIFLNNINNNGRYYYYDQNNGVYTDNSDVYKANPTVMFSSPKYQGYGLSSLTKGELNDLINGSTGVYLNQTTMADPDFARYFAEFKDQTVIASQALKLDNADKFWIKPSSSSSQDIYTNSRKDYNTTLNIGLAGYMGDISKYEEYINNNIYSTSYYTNEKSTYVDKNGKKWILIKSVQKPDTSRLTPMPYDNSATTATVATGETSGDVVMPTYIVYSAVSVGENNNLVTVGMNTTLSGDNDGSSTIKNTINNITVKKPIKFSMPKELGINIVNPQSYNYFITRYGDSQYPSYNAINTSNTGGSLYIYKNQYTNAKAYIKGQEKDYKYVINGNNSPMYIKSTTYENTNQLDIIIPVKESDGTDSTIALNTYVTKKSEVEDLKNLIDKALFTNVKLVKTKKNAKDFDNNVVNYFKNLSANTIKQTNTATPVRMID